MGTQKNRLNETVLLSTQNMFELRGKKVIKIICYFFLHIWIYDLHSYICQIQHQGTTIFQYCTCPAGRVTYKFNSSCKHMHLTFKSVCNKEHKGVTCNMTSSSNSSQSTCPAGQVLGKNYSSILDFTRKYERTIEMFVP